MKNENRDKIEIRFKTLGLVAGTLGLLVVLGGFGDKMRTNARLARLEGETRRVQKARGVELTRLVRDADGMSPREVSRILGEINKAENNLREFIILTHPDPVNAYFGDAVLSGGCQENECFKKVLSQDERVTIAQMTRKGGKGYFPGLFKERGYIYYAQASRDLYAIVPVEYEGKVIGYLLGATSKLADY